MTGKIVVANGMFRSGSTFFFDVMRQSSHHVCFYEPFHPQLNELKDKQHDSKLGHSIADSPWSEHAQYQDSSIYYDYTSRLPLYMRQKMAYYCPLTLSVNAAHYFHSLEAMSVHLNKTIFACFNRAAFILPQVKQKERQIQMIYVYTKRSSLQIVSSFMRLYSSGQSFNIYSRQFRDPWGITLLFDHHYTTFSSLHLNLGRPSVLYSFFAKVCYLNAVTDQCMKSVADFVLNIGLPLFSYKSTCLELLEASDGCDALDSASKYIDIRYRQDVTPTTICRSVFDPLDAELLDSISFSEYT